MERIFAKLLNGKLQVPIESTDTTSIKYEGWYIQEASSTITDL